MKITIEDVEHVAFLARLTFNEEEKELFTKQLNSILLYFDKLSELDTKDVEPTSHVIPIINVMRDDVVTDSISVDKALMNAPQRDGNYFKVPPILE